MQGNQSDALPGVLPSTWMRLGGTYGQLTRERQGQVRLIGRYGIQDYGDFTAWIGHGGEEAPDRAKIRIGLATPIDLAKPPAIRIGSRHSNPLLKLVF